MYLGLIGSVVASTVALVIAVLGWRRSDQRAKQDRDEAMRKDQAKLLAELLELSIASGGTIIGRDAARMKAILLILPGHLATVLRPALYLRHTMHVDVDPATAARMKATEPHDAGHKWWIFNRSSAITGRSFAARPEWVEAEIAYDIAGLLGGDQDAILTALSKDVRDMDTAIRLEYQRQTTKDGPDKTPS